LFDAFISEGIAVAAVLQSSPERPFFGFTALFPVSQPNP
jgi:hypothetical protein